MSDIKNVRSFLFEFKDGTELRLVEKENYDKLVEKIKELEEENRIFALEGSRVALKLHIEENYIPKQKVEESYLNMEKEYARKVYDDNYNRNEVKKEEFYKRQVYEELLEDK